MLDVGDIVLCTVDRVVGTVVFVKIEGEKTEGSIVLSEIAPGRIRNLRDYVVPKKKIVCKVLRIAGDNINLSLRRVTQKETKEIMEQSKQEKSYQNILKSVMGEKSEELIKKIKEKENLNDFFEDVKQNPEELEKLAGKELSKKILEIIKTQKTKKSIIKKEIKLDSKSENGLELIKEVLGNIKNAEIKYISAGRYSVKVESEGIKKADSNLKEILNEIERKAKKKNMNFAAKEK